MHAGHFVRVDSPLPTGKKNRGKKKRAQEGESMDLWNWEFFKEKRIILTFNKWTF